MKTIYLKSGREKSILRKHPWIFSGAVSKVEGDPEPGETVTVKDAHGAVLGKAAYSPISSIRARMWTFDQYREIDDSFFLSKIEKAVHLRRQLNYLNKENTACRLVYAESDGIPGLIVDQYDNFLVVQLLSAGPERWKSTIIQALKTTTGINNIFERSDVEVRSLEGLDERKGLLSEIDFETTCTILENGKRFTVDAAAGQKTGFYLDQRLNRAAIQKYAAGKKVLNCFSYTGAFSIYAFEAGADEVTSIDSSEDAHTTAAANLALNGFENKKADYITGDVFKELRLLRDKDEKFDMIIMDPPKFAPTAAQIRSASRGYKDINLLAFKLLSENGILATFSCSGGIDQKLFQKIVADSALDAGVNAKIIEHLAQGPDHPVALNFPEGAYLKGLICQVN